MTHSAPKHALRLPPCPDYDVEGTESWLTDMAARGLHLTEDTFFCGIAVFERGEPAHVRYRLEAAPKTTSMWAEDGGYPDENAVELSQDLGWEYVANRGQFYIYRSAAPGARELNTDPAVQALALETVCKRQCSAFTRTTIEILLWCFLYPLLQMRGAFLLGMIAMRTWFCLFGALLLLWSFIRNIIEVVHLYRLKKKLQLGEHIDHRKDWKTRSNRYHIGNFLRWGLTILWFALLLCRMSSEIMDEHKIPLADYTGDPPFATMEDWASGRNSYQLDNMGYGNTVEVWSDWLTPVNYDWDEIADVTLPDGRRINGILYVYYHEARSPALARAIAEEYLRKDRYQDTHSRFGDLGGYAPLELAPLKVDFATAHTSDLLHSPTVILQDGSYVLRASFYQYQSAKDRMTLDEWAGLLANSITTSKEDAP